MRNRIIHGYDTVDAAIVWDTVQLAIVTSRPLDLSRTPGNQVCYLKQRLFCITRNRLDAPHKAHNIFVRIKQYF
ncbi:MAG: DUF86 domain-containing protein [Planctomycetes bacterium]|nr:DUF86 domain-containing protein [Planctomycetota bacterium]